MNMENELIEIIDLTKVLDDNLDIYSNGVYSDPPFEVEAWCSIQDQGYKVSRLSMGTQTGTHIDAPAHFVANGPTLDMLPIQALIGQYLWIDISQASKSEISELRSTYNGETILFLTSTVPPDQEISEEVFNELLMLPCLVWVLVYGIRIKGFEPLYLHQKLSEAGKYIVEDVDEVIAKRVKPGGEIIALPLRLSGTSGAPCHIVVRQKRSPK